MYEGPIKASRAAAKRLRLVEPNAPAEILEQTPPRMDIKFPILGFLMEREATGYDLRRRFLDPIGFFYRVSDGSIYPALKKLARDGHVTVRNEKNGRRARKVYAITAEGRAHFKRMLRQPADPIFVFDEMQVKVYFGRNDPESALAHMRDAMRKDIAHAAHLRTLVANMRGRDANPFARIVMELGRAVVEAKAKALARLADELQRETRSFAKRPRRSRVPRHASAK